MPESGSELDRSRLATLANAAFRRAAAQVVRRARQFGTPILLWKDGKVLEVSPDEIVLPPEPEAELESPAGDRNR